MKRIVLNTESDEREVLGTFVAVDESVVIYEKDGVNYFAPDDCVAIEVQPVTYFAVPGHYVIGDAFDTLAEALAEAGSRVESNIKKNQKQGTFIPERSYVDERLSDADGDRVVRRYVVGTTNAVVAR